MSTHLKSEKYQVWITNNLITLERKLEYETAFDGLVKVYSLKSDKPEINERLKNKFFGDFIQCTETGAFLRLFISKTSWPQTTLIYIDFMLPSLVEIKKTNSSWLKWKTVDLGNGKYSIEISPNEKIEY